MGRRTRLTASAVLLGLALGTVPVRAADLRQPPREERGFLARLWQGLSELLPAVAKLGPELDPGGTPAPGQGSGTSEEPREDGGIGMFPGEAPHP